MPIANLNVSQERLLLYQAPTNERQGAEQQAWHQQGEKNDQVQRLTKNAIGSRKANLD
jgi:hypothetical protein